MFRSHGNTFLSYYYATMAMVIFSMTSRVKDKNSIFTARDEILAFYYSVYIIKGGTPLGPRIKQRMESTSGLVPSKTLSSISFAGYFRVHFPSIVSCVVLYSYFCRWFSKFALFVCWSKAMFKLNFRVAVPKLLLLA